MCVWRSRARASGAMQAFSGLRREQPQGARPASLPRRGGRSVSRPKLPSSWCHRAVRELSAVPLILWVAMLHALTCTLLSICCALTSYAMPCCHGAGFRVAYYESELEIRNVIWRHYMVSYHGTSDCITCWHVYTRQSTPWVMIQSENHVSFEFRFISSPPLPLRLKPFSRHHPAAA